MTRDELRKLERAKRKALWDIAKFRPGNPEATYALAILDCIDDHEQSHTALTIDPLELDKVRDSVPVHQHPCGIDIVVERDIPQPWRERFLQSSVGSTRTLEGHYASDWYKFLSEWNAEMRQLDAHRAIRHKANPR